MSKKGRSINLPKFVFVLQFVIFGVAIGLYVFAEDLGITRYLNLLVAALVLGYFVSYFIYIGYARREAKDSGSRSSKDERSAQPWEKGENGGER